MPRTTHTAVDPEVVTPADGLAVEVSVEQPFERFCRVEMPSLIVLARALSGSPAIAEDLAQEAMLAAYRRWDYVASLDRPAAWVRRVCANIATSHVRRRAAEARAVVRLGSRRQEPVALEVEHESFWAEVRRLPRRQAQAVALYYVQDCSVAETAAVLDCTEGAVKVHLSRARATLATRLGLETEDAS